MNAYLTYGIIFVILLALELCYFKVADHFNIIDKPNERSSHSTIVLRGGGIIFLIGVWIWSAFFGFQYPWFLLGLTLVASISFVDDIHSLPDSVRLVAQFAAAAMAFYQLGILHWSMWWVILLALIVYVGATNVINFMDGINGITAGYSLAVLIPLALVNMDDIFVEQSLIISTILASLVFCIFNFRPKGKAKCFAGDVGSIGIAFIILFLLGNVMIETTDITWLIFLLVYGVDGCLTIVHRIMLHENLGEAHRKHAYQIMANELKVGHVKVALLYTVMQLVISLGFIYLCPDTVIAHWLYLVGVSAVLAVAYILFMKKNYHLHEEYLYIIETITIMEFDKEFLDKLFEQAMENPRLRQNFDLRTSSADTSQRMLNALLPETKVPIHRHEDTTETVICLCGKLDEVIYEEVVSYEKDTDDFQKGVNVQDVARKVEYREVQRIHLNPTETKYGCQIPKGAWHTVEVIEPSVIFEAKDGAYAR